jgi:uncharacterized membrane protein
MNKTRLEAFSDSVLAIIITIMVLEIKVPHNTEGLFSVVCYVLAIPLAFVHTGISAALFILVAVVWLVSRSQYRTGN